jgi:hypothetical protein
VATTISAFFRLSYKKNRRHPSRNAGKGLISAFFGTKIKNPLQVGKGDQKSIHWLALLAAEGLSQRFFS